MLDLTISANKAIISYQRTVQWAEDLSIAQPKQISPKKSKSYIKQYQAPESTKNHLISESMVI